MATYASVLPSGLNTGLVSVARFFSVSLRGFVFPSTGARNRSRSVDHDSVGPTSRAAKTRPFPSGVKVNSSAPPKGLLGASASMPFITSTAVPPATGTTNRCERVPSFQVSQWRAKS